MELKEPQVVIRTLSTRLYLGIIVCLFIDFCILINPILLNSQSYNNIDPNIVFIIIDPTAWSLPLLGIIISFNCAYIVQTILVYRYEAKQIRK